MGNEITKPNLSRERILDGRGRVKCTNLAEGEYSGNNFEWKITNCMYQELADYGKSLGYNTCPICISALIASGLIGAMGLGEVGNINVEKKRKYAPTS